MRRLLFVRGFALAFVLALVFGLAAQTSTKAADRNVLVSVNVGTGQINVVGCVDAVGLVQGLAVSGSTGYAVTSANRLVTFSVNDPSNVVSEVLISGLRRGERLFGIDIRPADGLLYALGRSDTIYTIDVATGAATPIGSFTPGLQGSQIGFDFNPQADRIRIVSDARQNLRLLPTTGQVAAVDGQLRYTDADVNAGRTPRVSGAGYTNSVAGATSTQLFVIDTRQDVLALQSPPNDGTLTTIGSLGANISLVGGFDILPSSAAYAIVVGSVRC